MAGLIGPQNNAAQTGALRLVTTDLAGNIGTSSLDLVRLGSLDGRVSGLESRFNGIDAALAQVDRRAIGGIAASAALGGTTILPDKVLSISFNLATFRGQQGFSGSMVARVSERVYVSAGVAGSTVGGSTVGRVGVTFGL